MTMGSAAPSSTSHGVGNGNEGTEFMSMLPPPKDKIDGYDNTKPCSKQVIDIPPAFRDAMAVREIVYAEQGVPLEAEFDEDDARSWHWIAYASVASSSKPPKDLRPHASNPSAEEARRASATASRTPVATIRMIPPPHTPNKYIQDANPDKHPDASPPNEKLDRTHPEEPYVKLGRLATLKPYRGMGLAGLLINAVFDFAKQNPDTIYKPPSPTAIQRAQINDHGKEQQLAWDGLVMIHAQAHLVKMWEKHGFSEELRGKMGRWVEEGIEHVGMWRRLDVRKGKGVGVVGGGKWPNL
ncbi:acyl-CoA N-acyltransferase [Phaeosphaeriaceae sp. PMI808]|nr:acyl-CoA N-acyltransferase [Phaeosphaeriaceae sp. PMI808]